MLHQLSAPACRRMANAGANDKPTTATPQPLLAPNPGCQLPCRQEFGALMVFEPLEICWRLCLQNAGVVWGAFGMLAGCNEGWPHGILEHSSSTVVLQTNELYLAHLQPQLLQQLGKKREGRWLVDREATVLTPRGCAPLARTPADPSEKSTQRGSTKRWRPTPLPAGLQRIIRALLPKINPNRSLWPGCTWMFNPFVPPFPFFQQHPRADGLPKPRPRGVVGSLPHPAGTA